MEGPGGRIYTFYPSNIFFPYWRSSDINDDNVYDNGNNGDDSEDEQEKEGQEEEECGGDGDSDDDDDDDENRVIIISSLVHCNYITLNDRNLITREHHVTVIAMVID